jgi:hypothetical protein
MRAQQVRQREREALARVRRVEERPPGCRLAVLLALLVRVRQRLVLRAHEHDERSWHYVCHEYTESVSTEQCAEKEEQEEQEGRRSSASVEGKGRQEIGQV